MNEPVIKAQAAIIDKNTPEIRKRLEEMGYTYHEAYYGYNKEQGYSICTSPHTGNYSVVYSETAHNPDPRYGWACYGRVCCGTDEELFFKTIQEYD